jgi:hypothetical protein
MADEGWKVEEETLTERAFFKAPFYTENLKWSEPSLILQPRRMKAVSNRHVRKTVR